MRILITGGAGFIGCNLAAYFLRAGHAVTVFDNFSRRGSEANLAWLQAECAPGPQVIRGDVRDAEAIAQAARDQDAVFHLAGQVAVTTSVADPRHDFEANALGTFNTLEAARLGGRQPIFVYTSTNKVYGGMEEARVVDAGQRYAFADLPQGVPESWPLDFHSPYGCCYSADTDVLTRDGWKRFYDLGPDDEVLTYSLERRVAEFQRPTAHFAYRYAGKMYVQHGRRLQTCVTPNHKMLVAWDCSHDGLEHPHLREAREISGKPMAYLLAADVKGGDDCQEFALPIEEALAVMQGVGLTPVRDKHHVAATSRHAYEVVRPLGKSHDKHIPPSIKRLSARYLRLLLQALLDGDGNPQGKNGWRYTTVSRQLADDVQEIAIKCGLAAHLTLDPQGFYGVYINTTRTTQVNLDGDRSEWVDYDGMVYCVEVPNSVVMVRQNGCAYFSGNSKGAGDQYVRDYHRIYGLPSVVFRQSAIYGPRQFGIEDQGWLAYFAICAALGRPFTIYGDGKQVRDLLYIDDLARAFELAVQHIDRTAGRVYNVGGGPARTLSVWTETRPLLERLADRSLPVRFADWRPGDQRIYVSDIARARVDFGWEPQVMPAQGLQRLWDWIQANKALFE